MALERRFEQMMQRICGHADIPLRLVLWDGRRFDLSPSPTVTIAVPEPSALQYLIDPNFSKLGEAFIEGHIRVEGPIQEVFKVGEGLASSLVSRAHAGFHRLRRHSRSIDRKAIEYHYDVSNDFYALFLDENMVYSCAYFHEDSDSLEAAQIRKLDHILRKLALKPDERLLDIGCGWGALIRRAVQEYGAVATGVTISRNQFEYARERIRAEGLEGRCSVQLYDYRDVPGTGVYDKIVSVGMFEHVGLKNLPVYFEKIHSLLTDDGLVLNQGITSSDPDNRQVGLGAGEFIARYVFPEGELPHVSLVMEQMARAGFEVVDTESLRRHYARTCQIWAERLESQRDAAVRIAGEKRVRIWQIYLAGCAYGFAKGWTNIYQILAGKADGAGVESLPLARPEAAMGMD